MKDQTALAHGAKLTDFARRCAEGDFHKRFHRHIFIKVRYLFRIKAIGGDSTTFNWRRQR